MRGAVLACGSTVQPDSEVSGYARSRLGILVPARRFAWADGPRWSSKARCRALSARPVRVQDSKYAYRENTARVSVDSRRLRAHLDLSLLNLRPSDVHYLMFFCYLVATIPPL